MSLAHPFKIVTMNRATYTKTEERNTLEDATALLREYEKDENIILVTIIEYCPIRNHYSPIRPSTGRI